MIPNQAQPASSGNLSLTVSPAQQLDQLRQRPDEPHESISKMLRINQRQGFFHAMLSYRVIPDQDFVNKIHDKSHLLNSGSLRQQTTDTTRSLDSFPWPRAFQRHETVRSSSLRLFQDLYCLKNGSSWEGDGGTNSGGFLGALRLSVVFAPVFSAQKQGVDILPVGSVGQMI